MLKNKQLVKEQSSLQNKILFLILSCLIDNVTLYKSNQMNIYASRRYREFLTVIMKRETLSNNLVQNCYK